MENIEDQLKKYRLRKRRQEKIKNLKHNLKAFFMFGIKDKNEQPNKTLVVHDSQTDIVLFSDPLNISINAEGDSDGVLSSEDEVSQKTYEVEFYDSGNIYLKSALRIVYIALWFTMFIIAIELQFGIVFLMFSALTAIYLNTRTDPKKANEISAYSVFNKNCESIEGTLKAEQFEREIGIR